ncbi:MAG TPA: hypothetical protein VGB13_04655 [Candidatus Krumholzibacteria bacterium]
MSKAQQFLQKWFPLVVTCDGQKFPVEWFDTRGVARIAGKFVVSVDPCGGDLYEPREKTDPMYAYRSKVTSTWVGLWVEIIEHVVGAIDKSLFEFDTHLQSRQLRNPTVDPIVAGVPLSKLFDGMAVIRRDGYPGLGGGLPEYFWHLYEPLDMLELLDPMSRYIAHWL